MSNLRVGVIIGRFQVPALHNGHLRLYREVKDRSDRVVFLLGVSPVDTMCAEQPLSFAQRAAMIGASIQDPINILPLHNKRTDEEWSDQIDGLLMGTFPDDEVTLYGGRDSFTESYHGKLKVERLSMVPVIIDAGTTVRAALKQKDGTTFLEGQIYALRKQFPRVFPTVDVAVVKREAMRGITMSDEFLLIQRADSGRWCFPGGFADPTDPSFEHAASREIHEELGLTFASGARSMRYVGSYLINDWRYRGTRDKIMTTFFVADFFHGPVTPNYDEVQDYKWVRLADGDNTVSETHQPLWHALRNWAG